MNIGTPRFHASIVKAIADSSFRPTDEDVVTLVQTKVKAGAVDEGVGDTYFNVLRTEACDNYERDVASGMLESIDAANKRLMVLVNRGAITPDIEASEYDDSDTKATKYAERQKRTAFARTSASALRRYVKAGGDLLTLTLGKSATEKLAAKLEGEASEAAGENTPEAKVAKRLAGLITALNQIDEGSRPTVLRHVISTLEASC